VFGARASVPRPVLLLIVYGLFLVIVGVTATAQTVLVSFDYSAASLNATVGSDGATVRTFVRSLLRESDLAADVAATRAAAIEAQLAGLLEDGHLVRVEVRGIDGTVLYASEPGLRGMPTDATTESFATAVGGRVEPTFVGAGEATEAAGPALAPATVLREYFPLLDASGRTRAVVALWRDGGPLLAQLDSVRTQVVAVTLSGAAIVAILLWLIFRAAQSRITRQTEQLVESTRRDALTGLLNHGALVFELATAIERARDDDRPIGVALVDVDGFRLLNDTHGHQAGDDALHRVAAQITRIEGPDALVGRYGPDEFLVVCEGAGVARLEPSIQDLRVALADESLEFDATERLPLTVSAGIATFPVDASSVTELLSAVAVVLAEAKASGGDAVRVAGQSPETSAASSSFDVLQGLVFAVDTKDRYTKRHSEDVARYAIFLARRVGLDDAFVETLRIAGLLHDVGKIGIPDAVLRKPGKLTDEEYAIVKQHVALGDSIVRNVTNAEVVRTGVRHHHERWDGKGYLHGLAGEEIPLVARILAIGDAFSAMTTTRPYRKALSIEEALRRLGDAAGTQLDERLVAEFIAGLEHDETAPLPDANVPRIALWAPGAQVA
jgi:diguanylate cyclase (GGDEF)-like protein/putative nucleotidyltransferase with HDIG domain